MANYTKYSQIISNHLLQPYKNSQDNSSKQQLRLQMKHKTHTHKIPKISPIKNQVPPRSWCLKGEFRFKNVGLPPHFYSLKDDMPCTETFLFWYFICTFMYVGTDFPKMYFFYTTFTKLAHCDFWFHIYVCRNIVIPKIV